jgi:N-acetyldiaminopimelate deacetylase
VIDLNLLRRDLHRIPEPGFDEWKTRDILLSHLRRYPQLAIKTFDFPAILVEYRAGDGPYRLFRADMDALPIQEDTGSDFASIHPGWSHACGHDIHMTVLMGLIDSLMDEPPANNLLFLFQPAEEGLGGAKRVLNSGMLDSYTIEAAFALHVKGNMPVGTVASKVGRFFCIPQEFDVVFSGRGAHAAFPQNGADALATAAHFMTSVQSQMKMRFPATEPVVCHFGRIEAGKVRNAVADRAIIQGTTRAFDRKTSEAINTLLRETAAHVAACFGTISELKLLTTFDPVINDARLVGLLRESLPRGVRFEETPEVMTGEDFGYFSTRYPGLLFWLGGGCRADLHEPSFLPHDACIPVGVMTMRQMAVAPLDFDSR